jgi:hypothetical protein
MPVALRPCDAAVDERKSAGKRVSFTSRKVRELARNLARRSKPKERQHMWKHYMRRPMLVTACQWDGKEKILGLTILSECQAEYQDHIRRKFLPRFGGHECAKGAIPTNHGFIAVCPGDVIVKGESGELHAVPPEIFAQHYVDNGGKKPSTEQAMSDSVEAAVKSTISSQELIERTEYAKDAIAPYGSGKGA